MNFFRKLFGGVQKLKKIKKVQDETIHQEKRKYCNVNKFLVNIHTQRHSISKEDSRVSMQKTDPAVFKLKKGTKMDLWICEHTISKATGKFKCDKKCIYSLGVQMAAKSDFEIAGNMLNQDGTVPLEFLRRAGGINYTSEPKITDK